MAGSNPAMIVRVAANLAELKANLAEGKSQIETTTAGMQKLAASFSGDKLIQSAMNVTAAVNQIGGASKLTDSEMARVNSTIEKALEKYAALGREAPAGMQQLADATKGAGTATTSLTSALGSVNTLLGAFGLAVSVAGVVRFVGSVFDAASGIHDMSLKLGISAEAVQGFKFAAEQAGSSLDAVGIAITRMNVNLSEGDKGTVGALRAAGLEFSAIRSMKPEDAFLAITDAIAKIPDPMTQSEVALQLFGKSAAELLPAIKEGFRGAADAASKMSNETVDRLEKAQDAWGAVGTTVTIVTGEMIAKVFAFTNTLREQNFGLGVFGSSAKAAAKDIELLPPALDAAGKAAQFMAALQSAATVSLTTAQRQNLDTLKELGQLNAQNAEKIGVSADQYAKYTAEVAAAGKAETERATAAAKAHTEWESDFNKEMKRRTEAEAFKRKLKEDENKAIIDGNAAIMQAEAELADAQAKQWMSSTDFQIMKIWQVAEQEIKSFKGTEEQAAIHRDVRVALAQEQENAILASITRAMTAEETMLAKLAEDAVTTFAVIGKGADEVAAKVEATTAKAQADFNQAQAQYSMIGGTPSTPESRHAYDTSAAGINQNILDARERFEAALRNGRAGGGPVAGGSPYMVGERGPELFVPGASGSIVPNGGGGTTINVAVNVGGHVIGTQLELARLVKDALLSDARSLGGRL